jgi:Tol biopolymer transport system component
MAAGGAIDPRWSPDGTRIAFVMVPMAEPGPDAATQPEEVQAIYTIEIASGVVTRLSK